VDERGDELHLLPAIPDWWVDWGEEIRVERLPTHFGPLSLHVVGQQEGVWVDFAPPRDRPPRRTVLHLPRPRRLTGPVRGVELNPRAGQTRRWDYPGLVDEYLGKRATSSAAARDTSSGSSRPGETAVCHR
jgi:hypothetical protein